MAFLKHLLTDSAIKVHPTGERAVPLWGGCNAVCEYSDSTEVPTSFPCEEIYRVSVEFRVDKRVDPLERSSMGEATFNERMRKDLAMRMAHGLYGEFLYRLMDIQSQMACLNMGGTKPFEALSMLIDEVRSEIQGE